MPIHCGRLRGRRNLSRLHMPTARPAFDEMASARGEFAQQRGEPLSLLMIRVEYIGDRGVGCAGVDRPEGWHAATADCISGDLHRPGNAVACYDTSTFAVLLQDTDDKGALCVVERIGASVRALNGCQRQDKRLDSKVIIGMASTTALRFHTVRAFLEAAEPPSPACGSEHMRKHAVPDEATT